MQGDIHLEVIQEKKVAIPCQYWMIRRHVADTDNFGIFARMKNRKTIEQAIIVPFGNGTYRRPEKELKDYEN